jgi:hypothetical protein
MKVCVVCGETKPIHAKGMCNLCYCQLKKRKRMKAQGLPETDDGIHLTQVQLMKKQEWDEVKAHHAAMIQKYFGE